MVEKSRRELEFPVSFLYKAYNILVEKGEYSFNRYCNSVNMPTEDRERVRNKENCSHKVSELTDEIGG